MRHWAGWLLAAAMLPGVAWAQPRAEAERALRGCQQGTAAERQACEANAAAWRRDFEAAIGGDLEAQRRVAYALSGLLQPEAVNPVRPDLEAACMWRLVVTQSKAPGVGTADWDAQERSCMRQGVDFRAADDAASRILARITAAREAVPGAPRR